MKHESNTDAEKTLNRRERRKGSTTDEYRMNTNMAAKGRIEHKRAEIPRTKAGKRREEGGPEVGKGGLESRFLPGWASFFPGLPASSRLFPHKFFCRTKDSLILVRGMIGRGMAKRSLEPRLGTLK